MAVSARQNTMSVGVALCLVTLFAQALVPAFGFSPMVSPMYAPEIAPEGSPMYAPEMAPMAAPAYASEMAPMEAPTMAPPAYTPEASPVDSPTYASGPDMMAPGPAPIESGAARNMAYSFAVAFVGFAAFLLY